MTQEQWQSASDCFYAAVGAEGAGKGKKKEGKAIAMKATFVAPPLDDWVIVVNKRKRENEDQKVVGKGKAKKTRRVR